MNRDNKGPYAHSLEGHTPREWQPLHEHLENVASLAAGFAKPFGGEEWAHLAGLWHDLGKYADEFQAMLLEANGVECHLETKPGKVMHSLAGGHLSQMRLPCGMDRVFCWLIMGHHAGLADYPSDITGAKALEPKMRNPQTSEAVLRKVPEAIKNRRQPEAPRVLQKGGDVAFFIRMLFSCLVDADFLDTEEFMDRAKGQLRKQPYPAVKDLLRAFDEYMGDLCSKAKPSKVNQIRADVLAQCLKAAEQESSVFSLTVPTGGGKTLSSLAFALKHACSHNKSRIIYVIPYTSIIEQTASVFRHIPGFENAVVEHHSNVSNEDESKEGVRSRLAAENWDAPIIVTTSVQFFESLYACKTTRCRKLHNIVDSVVIFDEAQCLPADFLRPAVFAIRELHLHYGVTPVLCTATQPVLTKTESFDFKFREGFQSVTEIIDQPDSLSKSLQRVRVERFADLRPVSFQQVAAAIQAEGCSVLCIVNRKNDARLLSQLLRDDEVVHLSTNMCADHRFKTLEEIRTRLIRGATPIHVVSTSLVEAGVDLDFPVVYRALAGLDSIAQAAGRCNREGKLPARGKTVIFLPEDQPAYIQSSASLACEYLGEAQLERIFDPETFRGYFTQRFFQLGESALDQHGILGLLHGNLDFRFRTVADKFRLINDDWQLPLIVPRGEAPELVDQLLDWDARRLFRKLQRYTISIPKTVMWQLIDDHHVRELLPEYPGTYYLHTTGLYNERFGFVPPAEIDSYESETLVM